MRHENVTVVTGHKQRSAWVVLGEYVLYAGILYLIVNPGKIEAAQETLHRWRNGIAHGVSIARARAAIRSLPETWEP